MADCRSPQGEVEIATCAAQYRESRLTDRLTSDPAPGGVSGRLGDSPWVAPGWTGTPFVFKPGDSPTESDFSAQTSLGQWSSYQQGQLQRRIEEAKRANPHGVTVPKPALPAATGLDVWSSLDKRGGEGAVGETVQGRVGADYKLGRAALVGVAAGMREETAAVNALDHNVAAYVAIKPSPALTLGVKAEHGESAGDLAGNNLLSSQDVVSAHLAGAVGFGKLKFSPDVKIARGFEEGRSAGRDSAREKTSVKVAPRVSRPIALPGGRQLEPFVTYTNSIDVETAAGGSAAAAATRSVGGGFTLSRPDTYALSFSTDVEHAGEAENLKSRMQLSIPLR